MTTAVRGVDAYEALEVTIAPMDHGLIMMALAHLALDRGEFAARAEDIAIRLRGGRMFMELRDLKLRQGRNRV